MKFLFSKSRKTRFLRKLVNAIHFYYRVYPQDYSSEYGDWVPFDGMFYRFHYMEHPYVLIECRHSDSNDVFVLYLYNPLSVFKSIWEVSHV